METLRDICAPSLRKLPSPAISVQPEMAGALHRFAIGLRKGTKPLRKLLAVKRRIESVAQAFAFVRAKLNRSLASGVFIGVTGSSGKSTTVMLLSQLLEPAGSVKAQIYYNTFPELRRFLARLPRKTNFVPVEVGASNVGSIGRMARLLRPGVAIVTQIGIEHYTSFKGREGVAAEKGQLLEILPSDGLAILNADDPYVMAMTERTSARIITFGWAANADYQVVGVQSGLPGKLSVRLRSRHGDFDIATPFVSDGFWLATAAAFAAAVELGIAPSIAAARIATSTAPWNRSAIMETDGGPTFLIDCRKAPADSIPTSVAPLHKARFAHRRTVLGQLSDFKGSSTKAYRIAYQAARAASDEILAVGERRHKYRPSEEDQQAGKFHGFSTIRQVSDHIHRTARPDEIVLLKSAGSLHMERVALSWVQDVQCWEDRCGKSLDCIQCGMMAIPYEQHGNARRAARRQKVRRWLSKLFRP